MHVAVNFTTPLFANPYLAEVFGNLAKSQLHVVFTFYVNDNKNILLQPQENVQTILVANRNWWQPFAFGKQVKNSCIDVWISSKKPFGISKKISWIAIADKYNSKKYSSAKKLVSFSEIDKNKLVQKQATETEKIVVLPMGISAIFSPLGWEQKELVKEKISGGKEYFLCPTAGCTEAEILGLLKAFSLFKKRQQSNIQLLLLGKKKWGNSFTKKLENYKFRNEIIWLEMPADIEFAELLAGAYCMLIVSQKHTNTLMLMQALACGLPIISLENIYTKTICGEAAIFVETTEVEALAEEMKFIFKDENYRSLKVQECLQMAEKNCIENAASAWWNLLGKMHE